MVLDQFGIPLSPQPEVAWLPPAEGTIRRLLQGERGGYRDAVLLNAAAALMVAGHSATLADGAAAAAEALDAGKANDLLDRWIAYS